MYDVNQCRNASLQSVKRVHVIQQSLKLKTLFFCCLASTTIYTC